MLKSFYLYHTNDLHSHFQHWPQIVAYLKDARHRHHLGDEAVLQFDIGDHIDRAHPMTEGTSGRGNTQLLNEAGYDGVTIGNNEGITLEKTDLESLYDQACFPVMVANLFDQGGKRPKHMKPYEIFYLENGLAVGAIGITVPFTTFYESLGWHIIAPFDMLSDLIREVKSQSDVVVLLSHMGLFFDEKVARELNGIDIILGGHTHHLLEQGKRICQTAMNQSGKFGAYVGKASVSYDTETEKVVSCEMKSVPIDNYREDEDTKKTLHALTEEATRQLEQKVTTLAHPLEVAWFSDSPFAELLAESLKEWCHAEIGMANAGLLLESLSAGEVTKADLHRICPHPINPCKLKIRGDELIEMIRASLTQEMIHYEIKGLGFRGRVMGVMIFAGVEVAQHEHRPGQVKVQGDIVDPDREYEVATIDMFTLGKIFPGLSRKPVQYYLPEMLRDILAWKLHRAE